MKNKLHWKQFIKFDKLISLQIYSRSAKILFEPSIDMARNLVKNTQQTQSKIIFYLNINKPLF